MVKKYMSKEAVVDDLLADYIRRFNCRRGVPRSVAQLLFDELRNSLDSDARDLRGYSVAQIHDRVPADRFGEVPTRRAVEDTLRDFSSNLLAFRAEIETRRFEVGGEVLSLLLTGPTADARHDNEADRLWIHGRFRSVPLESARSNTPQSQEEVSARGETPALEDTRRWIDRTEQWFTENGKRWLFRRCAVFDVAFTEQQAHFICDANAFVLRDVARRGWIVLDPMSGRYSVQLTALKEAAEIEADEYDSLHCLHAALFAMLQFRQKAAPLSWVLPVDRIHADSARRYLLHTMNLDLQELADDALSDDPSVSSTVSLLRNIAEYQRELGRFEDASRTYAALANVAGVLRDKTLFKTARESFEDTTGKLADEDDRAVMRDFIGVVLHNVAPENLLAVGWLHEAPEDEFEGF